MLWPDDSCKQRTIFEGIPDYSCVYQLYTQRVFVNRDHALTSPMQKKCGYPELIAVLCHRTIGVYLNGNRISKFVPVSTQSQLSCVKSPWVEVYCLRKGFTMVYYRNLLTRGSANNPANWNSKQFTNISHNQVPTSVKII